MDNATFLLLAIAVLTALVWYYEYQLVRVTTALHSALDELDERSDLSSDPPFNLVLDDPVLLDAFRLKAWGSVDTGIGSTAEFSRSQIEEWN